MNGSVFFAVLHIVMSLDYIVFCIGTHWMCYVDTGLLETACHLHLITMELWKHLTIGFQISLKNKMAFHKFFITRKLSVILHFQFKIKEIGSLY